MRLTQRRSKSQVSSSYSCPSLVRALNFVQKVASNQEVVGCPAIERSCLIVFYLGSFSA